MNTPLPRHRHAIAFAALLAGLLASPPEQAHAAPGPERWLYLQTGFTSTAQLTQTVALVERCAREGYNGVVLADYRFMRWDHLDAGYRERWQRFRTVCSEHGLKLIAAIMPMGYSNSLLSRDPNLAEGLPVSNATFRVHGGGLVPEEQVTLANPGFENFRRGRPAGWNFVDDPGEICFQDTRFHDQGDASLRMQDVARFEPRSRHARACQTLTLLPFHYYHLRVSVMTRGWTGGDTRVMVLGEQGERLTFQNMALAPTQEWKRYHLAFNTLASSRVTLYLGTWDGREGTIWWDDVAVEPAGFVNILRRPGTPLVLTDETGSRLLQEGRDISPVRDPLLGMDPWAGDYSAWHTPPAVTIPATSCLKEGMKVRASYYHPVIIYDDQVTCCMNEPQVYTILEEQVRQVRDGIHPDGYLMSHDEIRAQGWDASCRDSGRTPAATLAWNIQRCTDLITANDPGRLIYIWSDMLDPNHNAARHGPYYLVKGDGPWYGSWRGLPRDIGILNWQQDPQTRRDSILHFAGLGHHQVLAGYYDGQAGAIAGWLREARGVAGVDGVMYTTWLNQYQSTEPFLKAAGSVCGPLQE